MSPRDDLSTFFKDVHWLMDILQHIDTGLIVLNRSYGIELWNQFMQNHSGKPPEEVLGKSIYSVFPELSRLWFQHKAESVFALQTTAFTTWEQRPYIFRFPHYRPITGTAEFMYQNSTLIPLIATNGKVDHICLIIYDVTDTAINKIAQQQANKQLQEFSRIDHLTGLYNRGHWESELIQTFRRYDRYQLPACLIMFDIDHFKRVNDTYGHTVGDDVIRQVSRALRAQLRDLDIAGRYGGEEFGVILTDTHASGALIFAERLRETIEKMVVYAEGKQIHFTVSIGIHQLEPGISDHRQWIKATDQALYKAKEGGRNRCQVAY